MKWSFLLRWAGLGCLGAVVISALIGSPTLMLINAVLAIILGRAAKHVEGDVSES